MTKQARRNYYNNQANNENGTGTAALVGAGGAALVSGAGGTTLTSCPPEDKSFYCQFVKGFNIFKMILFIVVVLIIGYIVYKMFAGNKRR